MAKVTNTKPEVVDMEDDVADTEGLVKVSNGREVLHVHPTTLDAHLAVGWFAV